MPRSPAEGAERWRRAVTELVDVVVDAMLDYAPDRAMEDVTDEEIKARGIVALRDLNARQNGARVDAPSLWNWGRKRWRNLVRQELRRRARRGTRGLSDEEAAAFLAALPASGEPRRNPPSEAPAPTAQRFRDDKSRDHPGWQLFEGVFSDSDVTRLLALKSKVKANEWANLFNGATWEPSERDKARICTALESKELSTSYECVVMPRQRKGWSVTVHNSAFRQRAHVGTVEDETWIVERIRPLLPENAVFPPPGHITYMIQNVRDVPRSESRGEQPMHYDFKPGSQRLGVVISLHDSVYVAVGDRWSEDVSKVRERVRVPNGSVFVFASSVPHAGMGDVGEDGVERIHIHVGLECAPKDVHPVGVGEDRGELLAY